MKNLFVVFILLSLISCARADENDINDKNNNGIVKIENNMFSNIDYYMSEYYDDYIKYHNENPGANIDDIVWMVNSGVHLKYFDEARDITDTNKFPLIVNKTNKLPDDFVPENLTKLPSGRMVTNDTLGAFNKMKSAASASGLSIDETSAYRSIDKQVSIYNGYLKKDDIEVVDTYSARPGFSEHHLGTVIDLIGGGRPMTRFGETQEYQWVKENAYKYGFIQRYKENSQHITGYMAEEWHITYVGEEIATYMHNNKIDTLEEYLGRNIQKPIDNN